MSPVANLGALLALAALAAPGASSPTATLAEAPRPAPVVSLGLDLSALDEATYRRIGGLALQKQVVLRLVQESFAVQAAGAAPDIVVLLEAKGADGLRLTARSRAALATRELALGGDEALQELHLEASQKIVELARAVTPPPAPLAPVPEPVAEPAPAVPSVPRWWSFDAAAGVDLLFRKGGNDWQGRVLLRWGGRFGARLTGALAPSQVGQLSLLDWTVLGGPSYRLALSETLALEVDLLAGALLHHYTFRTPFVSDRAGDRADFAAALPVTLSWESGSGILFALRVAGRVAGRGREHLLNQVVVWRREAFGLEAGLVLGKRF